MNKIMNKAIFTLVLSLVIFARQGYVFAQPHERRHGPEPVCYEIYRYHDGRFYRPLFFGLFEVAVAVPPAGAVIAVLPPGYQTIIAGRATYYYDGSVYYMAVPSGYAVVPAPIIAQTAGETITINVPNANGSYTPVVLTKKNDGYLGPQGEYYPGHPTVQQLQVLYGK